MSNLPHVTGVISFCNQAAYANIPAEIMAAAQARGTDFHRLAALHAQKLWIDDIPESCTGFFHSFTTWFDEFVEELMLVESRLVHPVLNFEGTPDIILRVKGDKCLSLADWKTPVAFLKSWRLQLAAYCALGRVNGYPIGRVFSLQPRKDGGPAVFKEYTKSLDYDWNVFVANLMNWNYYNQ